MKNIKSKINLFFVITFLVNSISVASPEVILNDGNDEPPIRIIPREGTPYCQSGCGSNTSPDGRGYGHGTGSGEEYGNGEAGSSGAGAGQVTGGGSNTYNNGEAGRTRREGDSVTIEKGPRLGKGTWGGGGEEIFFSGIDRSNRELSEKKAWEAYRQQVETLDHQWKEEIEQKYKQESMSAEKFSSQLEQWLVSPLPEVSLDVSAKPNLDAQLRESLPAQLSSYDFANYNPEVLAPYFGYEFSSTHKVELNDLRSKYSNLKPKSPQAYQSYLVGLDSLIRADKSYLATDEDKGNFYRDVAKIFFDIATDVIPLTSIPKDLYRLFVGKDPLTGREIESYERMMAGGFVVLAAASFGAANFLKGLKEAKAISKITEAESRMAEKVLLEAKNSGALENLAKQPDKWSRLPKSIQDQMTLEAAMRGEGEVLPKIKLNDQRYKGMDKMEYKTKSGQGRDSVVHYVRDPDSGRLLDFKFKKHSVD